MNPCFEYQNVFCGIIPLLIHLNGEFFFFGGGWKPGLPKNLYDIKLACLTVQVSLMQMD